MTASTQSVAVSKSSKRRLPKDWKSKVVQYATNLILVIFFIFPLVFMIMASFKPNDQIFADLRSLRAFLPVGDLSLTNYQAVFAKSKFPRFLFNSLFISVTTILLSLIVNSMLAYALSRLKWAGQKLVLAIIIATLIIPGETVIMPLLLLVSKLPGLSLTEGITTGWLNTYHVQIIPFIVSAFSIFLFYQFFRDIPKELDEAALVDGASRFQIYYKIILPNSGPVIATVTILTFIGAWNSFLWPTMVIQSEELRPVMVGMQYFFQQDTEWGEVMAYAAMITIPVLLVFLLFQRSFVQSIASSGIKG
ncbi:MAG: carbohydrate ABC transporter permease [Anaerolineae bacterium]|nr:carbohydrate ABC transporter permease [Anaerolineae bacterium]MCB9132429.1 carbohydrate ABC transporter permease [Anaerolineales bacterium]MCB0232116.1 carbohydrate ABC transporter permease [Anaerolineae bacterium]MCB0241453.1 carbohydrate ABC transporter permease [Anaerolineae bacterium]MCB0250191.1 carbohydrate ABC transporter permease [Anaerolineae bacterium]